MSGGPEIDAVPYFAGALALPEPRADGADRPFWEAAREHRLAVQRCRACGNSQLPPEIICTACQSRDVEWHDVEPSGTLTSFTRIWHPLHPGLADKVPYLVGVVEVAPGARLIGNILGDLHRDDLRFDMRMAAVFEDHDDATLIQWRPA